MVFLKHLDDLKFSDLERLKTNKICESQILDYKEALIEDRKLIKNITAFANTQGGFLIFGIKETGRGGYPENIVGVDQNNINTERLEQIILSNTQPRINVKIKEIEIHDTPKSILIIEIPNSYLKPHMSTIEKKFYKRFQNQATAMNEMEVNDSYKRRYTGYQEVEKYVNKLLSANIEEEIILGQIIVIPTLGSNMIDTSHMEDFSWMDKIILEPKIGQRYPLVNRTPSPNGIKCQIDKGNKYFQKLEIHRNGCVHFVSSRFSDYYHYSGPEKVPIFLDFMFCIKMIQTLQLASTLYKKYNYFGDIQIICNLQSLENTNLLKGNGGLEVLRGPCQIDKSTITREVSSLLLDFQREYIASGIMDEVYNSYGEWKCNYFDDKGKLIEDKLL